MGKKKNRQNSNIAINLDSSESGETVHDLTMAKPGCIHLNKSIEPNTLRKNFRGNGHLKSRQCSECKKQDVLAESEDIWLCLRCGSCACGPDKNNHSLNHFETPRSDSHSLAIKLETLTVWCYECKLEVSTDCSQKLHNCVDTIRQHMIKCSSTPRKNPGAHVTFALSNNNNNTVPTKNQFVQSMANKKEPLLVSRIKVKGLMNLGNTCFFNSVLQCLARTPGLADTLTEMQEGGQKFTLPIKDREPLTGELDKGGQVSESLLELIMDMNNQPESNTTSTNNCNNNNVLIPRKLLANLRKRCPQFEGSDQHDSHELLRHLLDVVRNEDLRRYQRIILEKEGLSAKVDPASVAEEKRKTVKELNNRVNEEFMIRPDQVFRGSLVSELQCQVCFHLSSRQESFLDLSLPVALEKPQPPVVARRKYNFSHGLNRKEEETAADSDISSKIQQDFAPSSEQASASSSDPLNDVFKGVNRKLEADSSPYNRFNLNFNDRVSRKRQRLKKNNNQLMIEDQHGEHRITEEDKKETSDADIEDNDDMGTDDTEQKADIIESGYSSEKPASSRTSPTAESSKDREGDDSACASPCASISEGDQKSSLLSDKLTSLTLGVTEEQGSCVEPTNVFSPLIVTPLLTESSMCPATITPAQGLPEAAQSTDSSSSLRANPGFSSPDLSTESLQDIGLHGQDHSYINELDESQSGCKGGDLYDSCKENCLNTDFNDEGKSSVSLERSCHGTKPVWEESSEEELTLDCGSSNQNEKDKVNFSPKNIQQCDGTNQNENDKNIDLFYPQKDDSKQEKWQKLHYFPNNQKDDSRPSSRLEYNTLVARSSPVEIVNNQTLDSNLLNMSLQSYKTECLSEIKDQDSDDDDVFSNMPTESLLGPFTESDKETNKPEESRTVVQVPEEKRTNNEMAFVLVGGIASGSKSDLSVNYSKPNDLSRPESGINVSVNNTSIDHESTEVNPDLYRSRHITLAPRYQCEKGECSVLSCLNHFTAIEMMAGNNKAGCDHCTQRQNKGKEKDAKTVYTVSTKRLLISSPPPVLILHLKRFQVQMCSFRKITCHISFPVVLDIAPFCAASCQKMLQPSQSQILYSLYGVVEHSGTLRAGHYIAYVKVKEAERQGVQPKDTWYYISDSHTSQVTLEKVLKSQAYLLFYERIL